MPVVFLLLALGVLAAIALVAAGRGDALAEAEPDVRPVGLPDDELTPGDLAAVRFPAVLRGYRMADVDAVIERAAAELALRDARIAELQQPAQPADPFVKRAADNPSAGNTSAGNPSAGNAPVDEASVDNAPLSNPAETG